MWLPIGILLIVLVIGLRLIARMGRQTEPPAPALEPATQAEPDPPATPAAPFPDYNPTLDLRDYQ